ncbi:hypothetical protein M422DRAFT_268936 [Sphaerobolus stellatus SS14]|uniref:Unplaced genomic scaffold SPHSTscaffold_204, whole genome shotgun sequence n=1 Tax=Sphaerobolus stellatus (strain SS14) TaxID=990650 RepID=A0A0C9UL97_SPHS4|nr:hypothetical protein M422DRAFT_268936 [Sphaerobolus stellatus SS14]
MATIAGVTGNQFTPTNKDYLGWAYQYATSTYQDERDMNPGLIAQPKSKDDIKKVIQYAVDNKKAIAIRTGGHQYSGASTTGKANIQLDLRESFRNPDDLAYFEVGPKSYVRASVSHNLGEFNAFLGQHNVFVPHGQCVEVHLGGHVQTGGYGQLGRSFGLLGDHVTSLEIIDYAGNEKEITKSDTKLFYAWLGGSPGNLGVLTHFTIEVHRDSDYEGSIGLRVMHLYDTSKLRELIGYLAEMSDNPDFPRNYDLCISILSANADMSSWMNGLDEEMEREHPEIFGEDGNKFWPRMIVVYAQWVPFSPTDKPDMAWFDRLKNDSWFFPGDDVERKPMSELTAQWIFRNTREFNLPYVKRTYVTKSTDLSKNGWVDWVVSRMDRIVEPSFNDQWLSAQLQCFGGKNSMFTRNADNGTSYSWRDQTMCMTIDNFHYPEKKEEAEQWAKENDEAALGPNGIFSKEDRRVLWGSWGSFDLNAEWRAYYDSEEKYKRIQAARKMADPNGTFTPNTFAVKRAD